MKEIVYQQTGEPVLAGDRVRLRRRFLRDIVGVVNWVYDPSRPSPPGGDNDFGFSVRVSSDEILFVGAQPNDRLELIERCSES